MRHFNALVLILIFLPSLLVAQPSAHNWVQRVRTLIASKQFDCAEKMIVARMMTKPQDPELVTLLAEVRLDQGRFGEALDLLSDANGLGGVTALRAVLTGLVQTATGRLDLAEPEFRKATQLDPSYAAAHYFLGRLLYTRNHFDEAIQESKETIALSPCFVRAYENLGLCYEGEQRLQEAEHWYLEAIHREDGCLMQTEWPMLDLATMLIKENEPSKAKPYLVQALKINPDNPHAVYEMGVLQEGAGDLRAALIEFTKAIRLDPQFASAYYRAARVCQRLGDWTKAQTDFAMFEQISERDHTQQAEEKPLNNSTR